MKKHICLLLFIFLAGTALAQGRTIKVVQVALDALGFDPGPADGILGPRTRAAIKQYRSANSLGTSSTLDASTLRSIALSLNSAYPDNSDAQNIAAYLIQVSQQSRASPAPGAVTPNVIESYITSGFNGLKYGNLYKLANGQIWEQSEAWTWTWTWTYPKVTIRYDRGSYRMKVQGIDRIVGVRRIR